MSKAWTVAVNEYLKAVRSKAFVIGIVLMPLLFGGGIIGIAIAERAEDLDEQRFAVVDRTGRLLPAIERALAERNASELHDEHGEPTAPRWTLEPAPPGDDRRPDVVFSELVETRLLLGFLTIGADVFAPDGAGDQTLAWSTDTPTNDDLPDWLANAVNEELRRVRFEQAAIDPGLVAGLTRRVPMRTQGLVTVDRETGAVEEAEPLDEIAQILIPVALLFLMFMLVMMSAPALLNNVLEEKMQKIAEVLVSSVSPFELLLGKLASAVAMSMTLAVLYLGGALVFAHAVEGVPPPVLAALGPGVVAWFVFFMLLMLVTAGSIFAALGAACSEIQDSQTLMMPAMIMLVLPMMLLGAIVKSPDGTLAQVLSFVPPITPMIMFLRMTMPPGVPWWELLLAVLGAVLFSLASVWAAAKIFRIGLLSQGQTPSFRTLASWIIRG